jgi:SET domain-containing protein
MSSPVRVAPSPIHGGGLFAGRAFAPGERIIEYQGERISKAESIRRCSEGNHFIFYLDEQNDLDGNSETNPARFMNHRCSPNCVVELIDGSLWVTASEPIASGEELTFDYGYDLADYRDYPCNCGAPACFGYILAEEFRAKSS